MLGWDGEQPVIRLWNRPADIEGANQSLWWGRAGPSRHGAGSCGSRRDSGALGPQPRQLGGEAGREIGGRSITDEPRGLAAVGTRVPGVTRSRWGPVNDDRCTGELRDDVEHSVDAHPAPTA